ncbi:hypothetical protein AB0B94_30990 [Micromonospora sp. NPDC048986]|uniref:hypothetical protein n=1 Tax=Micromonospora sp. NPDC048986 TaxID=3155644 RepID=UPI00340C3405
MSRILVANDSRTVHVEVFIDQAEGSATAACEGCDWTTEPGRVDYARDVINHAGNHVDREHP